MRYFLCQQSRTSASTRVRCPKHLTFYKRRQSVAAFFRQSRAVVVAVDRRSRKHLDVSAKAHASWVGRVPSADSRCRHPQRRDAFRESNIVFVGAGHPRHPLPAHTIPHRTRFRPSRRGQRRVATFCKIVLRGTVVCTVPGEAGIALAATGGFVFRFRRIISLQWTDFVVFVFCAHRAVLSGLKWSEKLSQRTRLVAKHCLE